MVCEPCVIFCQQTCNSVAQLCVSVVDTAIGLQQINTDKKILSRLFLFIFKVVRCCADALRWCSKDVSHALERVAIRLRAFVETFVHDKVNSNFYVYLRPPISDLGRRIFLFFELFSCTCHANTLGIQFVYINHLSTHCCLGENCSAFQNKPLQSCFCANGFLFDFW